MCQGTKTLNYSSIQNIFKSSRNHFALESRTIIKCLTRFSTNWNRTLFVEVFTNSVLLSSRRSLQTKKTPFTYKYYFCKSFNNFDIFGTL